MNGYYSLASALDSAIEKGHADVAERIRRFIQEQQAMIGRE